MQKPCIIITIDYEMPGNGTGDVMKSIVEPANRLVDILDGKNIKMTLFFEMEEFITFNRYSKALENAFGYNPAFVIEEQIKRIVHSGHEIGLHIHPQWIDSTFDGTRFKFCSDHQYLSDIFFDQQVISSFFKERVERLETIVKKYDQTYKVRSYRAGGLVHRPENETLKALNFVGIKADSSVVKDFYRKGKKIDIDYRNAPRSKGYWYIRNKVCNVDTNGSIVEFPIHSQIRREYQKLTYNRIIRKFFLNSRLRLKPSFELAIPKTPWGLLLHLLSKNPIKYDFCHMTKDEMISFFKSVDNNDIEKQKYPLTMIGHSKEFFNDRHFSTFLDFMIDHKLSQFMTMRKATETIERFKLRFAADKSTD